MKRIIISLVLFYSLHVSGQTTWRQSLRYDIRVKFNDTGKSLDAKMHLLYTNHSPDTLSYIWFHLWPNAYRNDRTAYSEQELENQKTDFYFSSGDRKGYINRLDFHVDGLLATIQDDPDYIDIIKLNLPKTLNPGDSISLEVAFHVHIPFNFSGTGYKDRHFEIKNWYPEPAVYDAHGWHKMPFLEQGGAFHENADFNIVIESPRGYRIVTGATPDSLQNTSPANSLYKFSLRNANAFSWIADKKYILKTDTVLLNSGQQVAIQYYYFKDPFNQVKNNILVTKEYLKQISDWLTPYPHKTITIVQSEPSSDQSFSGLLCIGLNYWPDDIHAALRKQLLGQWFQTIVLSDQRNIPWLSKGFVHYYNDRLLKQFPPVYPNRVPFAADLLWLRVAEKEKNAQPISTPSPDFSTNNDSLIAYTKAGLYIEELSQATGEQNFDKAMQDYFDKWSFHHPYPEDLQYILDTVSGKNLQTSFDGLVHNKSLFAPASPRKLKAAYIFSAKNTTTYNYIGIAPALGYNRYDDIMLGLLIHNINLPANNFEFLATPLYAFGSKTIEGLGRMSYSWHPDNRMNKITVGINGGRFARNKASDTTGKTIFENFSKIVPYIRIDFKPSNPRSSLKKWADFKTYLITEKSFDQFTYSSKDSLIHPNSTSTDFRYVNQMSFNIHDDRALYPYDARLELQQSEKFYRVNLHADYFLNYPDGGGLQVRFFASKFGTWSNNNNIDLTRYEPKLLGVTGDEDYLYEAYFIGRSVSSAFENSATPHSGIEGQQIMNRDGGLKLRTDEYQYVQGRSANWVTALNFNTTLPAHLFPIPIPLRIYFDIGTYAEAWENNATTNRFLYTGGMQLSLFKNVLNIYAPLIYSSDFKDALSSVSYGRRITFSIDIQNIKYKWLMKKMLPLHE